MPWTLQCYCQYHFGIVKPNPSAVLALINSKDDLGDSCPSYYGSKTLTMKPRVQYQLQWIRQYCVVYNILKMQSSHQLPY